MADATWLLSVLREAAVTVRETDGWRTRGHSDTQGPFRPSYVLWHHDASAMGPSPGMLALIIHGRAGIPGPLANCWVDTTGTWWLVAAGVAYHAGTGGPYATIPRDEANRYSIGIETDHTAGEPWQPALLASLERGTAAILAHVGRDANPGLLFHKTWAPTRKIDPSGLVLGVEQARVQRLIVPTPTPPTPTPTPPPTSGEDDMAEQIAQFGASEAYYLNGDKAVPVSAATSANLQKAGVKLVGWASADHAAFLAAFVITP